MFEIEAYSAERNEWDLVKEVNKDDFEEALAVYRGYLTQSIAETGLRMLNDRGITVRLCHA